MNKKIDLKVQHKKHQRYWRWSLKILRPLLSWIYKYEYKLAPEIAGNYMVLSNHNSNLDPWLCALSFDKQMYFLAAENLFRMGFLSWIIKKLWSPISKLKGKSDASAIINLMRHIKAGCNVSLFPEGNRSFTGITGDIFPATGKLVKTSGITLVTFKITGMYFTAPRWAKIIRRGKTSGKVIGVYSSAQLEKMTSDEINNLIKNDIFEDAYEQQKINPIEYNGRTRAEGIEAVLYMCPKCKKIGTIQSKKIFFHCQNCKAKAEFTKYGYIKGDFQFKTIPEWDNFQKQELHKLAEVKNTTDIILQDNNIKLVSFNENHQEQLIDSGTLKMFKNKLTVGNTDLLFSDILNMSIVFRKRLLIVTKGNKNYEVKSKTIPSVRNYFELYNYLSRRK